MRDLAITVSGVDTVPFALTPQLDFTMVLEETAGERVDAVALNAQIMIEAVRRAYQPPEQEALLDLFGIPARWGRTLKTMVWTHVSAAVPAFNGRTEASLVVDCSYDLALAATKYFFALQDGEVPLSFQFSGTVFYRDAQGDLQVSPIPWTSEAAFRLPVAVWRRLMDEHYPNTAWLCLRRDVFDRLYRLKAQRGLPTWEELMEEMLQGVEPRVPS